MAASIAGVDCTAATVQLERFVAADMQESAKSLCSTIRHDCPTRLERPVVAERVQVQEAVRELAPMQSTMTHTAERSAEALDYSNLVAFAAAAAVRVVEHCTSAAVDAVAERAVEA